MKVLITGAGGQVGQALVGNAPDDVELVPTSRAMLDITDEKAVNELILRRRPDLVINAAACTSVDRAETEPALAREVNEIGARIVAAAASSIGARLIQISTDYVFDGASSTPYSTDATPAPLGVYGATKLAGERAVLETLGEGAIVLRTAWVYSMTGHNFLLTMLRLIQEEASVRVVSDQIGQPTAAESVARAAWALGRAPDLHGIFHWTDSGTASWYDFAVAIAEGAAAAELIADPATIIPITSGEYPTKARRPPYSVLDTRKTVSALGIVPPNWRDSLRRVLGGLQRV
jgi:dTDP-4-dehydrorhamnose reductase